MNSNVLGVPFSEEILPKGLNESIQKKIYNFLKKFVINYHINLITKNYSAISLVKIILTHFFRRYS